MNTPQAGQVYKHYRGSYYKVVAIGKALNIGWTTSELVTYMEIDKDQNVYIRSVEDFCELVDIADQAGVVFATVLKFELLAPENKTFLFNINNEVQVRLNDEGREYLLKQHLKDFSLVGYTAPVEDSEGWSTWQLWKLINTFGGSMIGCGSPFSTEIRILR
jgi:hypothetical protein